MKRAEIPRPLIEFMDHLAERAKAIWQRHKSANEVACLGRPEATCIARDLGISTNDLRALAGKDKNSADLLVRRMATLGLDPTTLDGAVMHDLQRCCSLCRNKELCIHELEDKPREVSWPKYCPNEYTLTALTTEQSSGIAEKIEDYSPKHRAEAKPV
jgi:hypothetical protein